jgi:hypothetical protein
VVRAAEPIMEIVPDHDVMIVEASIDPTDIDQVRVGQAARVRFSAFNRAATPEIPGRVIYVATDRTDNQETRQAYYTVRIAVDQAAVRAKALPCAAACPPKPTSKPATARCCPTSPSRCATSSCAPSATTERGSSHAFDHATPFVRPRRRRAAPLARLAPAFAGLLMAPCLHAQESLPPARPTAPEAPEPGTPLDLHAALPAETPADIVEGARPASRSPR